ncbi:MAG: hypothetical protein RL616_1115 [Verrucomicrobiota bacterium]|jgi:hypothetical protein
MKNLSTLALCLGCVLAANSSRAADLKQSKVTQVVNDVQIISAASQSKKSATVDDAFNMPDILRTGPSSRAELVAPDETVTRVGANTIFSFDPANRTIDLKQGSLLFHSPHGKGGGTIHTGSATASVLGSTLIVTTTASGGFKVLALEDEASITFTNGLKQKLQPGQMTFVLPGGSQLAPVIIFRLDDLAKNSQLVKGFTDKLPSLPLIQKQIEKQEKVIQSGGLNDTGLVVGDDADEKKVKVIDLNTLQSELDQTFKDPTGFKAAIHSDATINQPSIISPLVPTPPNHIFLNAPFALSGDAIFSGHTFRGFVARNIFFNTQQITEPLFTVDLSAYAGLPEFDFVAADYLNFGGSVTFTGLEDSEGIYFALIGGKGIRVAPGSSICADLANFAWLTPGSLTFVGGNVNNNFGNVIMNLGGNFSMSQNAYFHINDTFTLNAAGSITVNASTVGANTALFTSKNSTLDLLSAVVQLNTGGEFTADQDLTLSSSLITADTDSGSLTFTSKHGSINSSGSSFETYYLTLDSGKDILLDGNGCTIKASVANFTAAQLIDVKNANLTQMGTVNMSANTINLSDVSFAGGSAVTLKSLLGLLNVGSSVPGKVNFIQNVTYGGNPAQNYVNNGGGITVTTRN